MRALIVISATLLSAGRAMGHGVEAHGSGAYWTFDPWVIAPLALFGILYGVGFLRLRARSSQPRMLTLSACSFFCGWLVLVIALVSPLHFLGEHLFTLHMVEHELVMTLSAPLIVLARPIGVLFWGMPRWLRIGLMRILKATPVELGWDLMTAGIAATMAHGAAIWIWHLPPLFDATVSDVALHRLQHLSFFITGVVFWWAIIWKAGKGAGAWYLFITMMHTSILGALITVSPRVLYISQTLNAPDWGLTPLEDQQLAGIVMWVPGGVIYAAAGLALLAKLITSSRKERRCASLYS